MRRKRLVYAGSQIFLLTQTPLLYLYGCKYYVLLIRFLFDFYCFICTIHFVYNIYVAKMQPPFFIHLKTIYSRSPDSSTPIEFFRWLTSFLFENKNYPIMSCKSRDWAVFVTDTLLTHDTSSPLISPLPFIRKTLSLPHPL